MRKWGHHSRLLVTLPRRPIPFQFEENLNQILMALSPPVRGQPNIPCLRQSTRKDSWWGVLEVELEGNGVGGSQSPPSSTGVNQTMPTTNQGKGTWEFLMGIIHQSIPENMKEDGQTRVNYSQGKEGGEMDGTGFLVLWKDLLTRDT